MQVKRYVAPTFAEALIQAKNELGTDAIIVEHKKLYSGGFLGLFGKQMTELTMAVDRPTAPRARQAQVRAIQNPAVGIAAQPERPQADPPALDAPAEARHQAQGHISMNGATDQQVQSPAPPASPAAPAPPADVRPELSVSVLSNLEREVTNLRVAVARLLERNMAPVPLHGYGRIVYDRLVAGGVEEAAALDIGRRIIEGGEAGERQLRLELERLMGPFAPIEVPSGQRRVVALVGPTGVGKTTTLAKLAARFTLEEGKKVALITSDTFRIAAVEQLRTYADILGLPLHPVDSHSDVARALQDTAGHDLVLVDTGGRNHRDEGRMQELRELLAILRPDETHLVFALNANPRDAFQAMEYYLPLGVNRIAFTKLDETAGPGLMLNIRMRCNQPFSYITDGQSVPDDIAPANQVDLAKIMLGA